MDATHMSSAFLSDAIHALNVCRKKKQLERARALYKRIQSCRFDAERSLGSYLVAMFVECGAMEDAYRVFGSLTDRNVYAWTSLMRGCVESGDPKRALELYGDMKKDRVCPNSYTFQFLLRSCAALELSEKGRELHAEVAEEGLEKHPFVGTALVDMYSKNGCLEEAQDAFDELFVRDVVAWTALITGYIENGFIEKGVDCFRSMRDEGVSPNSATLLSILRADFGASSPSSCSGAEREEMHAEIVKLGLETDPILGNALVDMHAKRGMLEDAHKVFDDLTVRDVVSWTSVIMGYAEQGLGREAFASLEMMRLEGVPPNDVTYVCTFKACGGSGDLGFGREVHIHVCVEGFDLSMEVGNALVAMYAKCGSLSEAGEVFDKLHARDVVSWSALIAGYADKGESKSSIHLFERMKEEKIDPDSVIFLSVLKACSHAGLVSKARDVFNDMIESHDIAPTIEHYNCMLDVLGRAGQLVDALLWIEKMPIKPNIVTWNALLAACQKWRNVEVARRAFDGALRLDVKQATCFVVMSSIYNDAGMWAEAMEIDELRAAAMHT